MPRVVARYIAWGPSFAGSRADFITRVMAAVQCWKTPPRGHNSGTLAGQDAIQPGDYGRSFHRTSAHEYGRAISGDPGSGAGPDSGGRNRTRPAARPVSRAGALADFPRSRS